MRQLNSENLPKLECWWTSSLYWVNTAKKPEWWAIMPLVHISCSSKLGCSLIRVTIFVFELIDRVLPIKKWLLRWRKKKMKSRWRGIAYLHTFTFLLTGILLTMGKSALIFLSKLCQSSSILESMKNNPWRMLWPEIQMIKSHSLVRKHKKANQ